MFFFLIITFCNKQWEKRQDCLNYIIYFNVTVQNCHIPLQRANNGEMINTNCQKKIAKFNIWSVITLGIKRFLCLMHNCTHLNICEFCFSDRLSSPKSKVSIITLSRNCRLFVNCSRASKYKQHSRKNLNSILYYQSHGPD